MSRARRWTALLVPGALALAVVGGLWLAASEPDEAFAAAVMQVPVAPDAPDAGLRSTVRIIVLTVPPERAELKVGKRTLGVIKNPRRPFILERPRDSGPIDLTVRVQGYLPVHTRAYTFSDSKLYVRLTPVTEKHTLFGYRQATPDGGAPPTPTGAPPDAGVR